MFSDNIQYKPTRVKMCPFCECDLIEKLISGSFRVPMVLNLNETLLPFEIVIGKMPAILLVFLKLVSLSHSNIHYPRFHIWILPYTLHPCNNPLYHTTCQWNHRNTDTWSHWVSRSIRHVCTHCCYKLDLIQHPGTQNKRFFITVSCVTSRTFCVFSNFPILSMARDVGWMATDFWLIWISWRYPL